MAYRLRTIDPETRFVDLLRIDLFAQLLPHSQILAILHTTQRRERRVRKLSQAVIVCLIIAMNIWTHVSLAHVFQKLARGLRFVWPTRPCRCQPDMLLMWDRGFHSYAMFAETLQRGAQVLARFSMIGTPKIRQTLADGSALIDLAPADDGRLPDAQPIQLRLITYQFTDPALGSPTEIHRVVTSLLDPVQYPATDLVCAYHKRWEIEIVIDELDTHQRVVGRPLRSQQPVGVLQELYGLLIAHYLIRTVMHDAAVRGELDPDRISFVHAVRVIQDAIAESQMLDPACLPQLYARLLVDLRAQLLLTRRVRMYPRVIKQKMSRFLRKRPEHTTWPQPTCPFQQVVAIIPDLLTEAPAKRPYRRSPRTPAAVVDA